MRRYGLSPRLAVFGLSTLVLVPFAPQILAYAGAADQPRLVESPDHQTHAPTSVGRQNEEFQAARQPGAEPRGDGGEQVLVQPGTKDEAEKYYERISKADAVNFHFEGSTLDALLAYMGYALPTGVKDTPYSGLLAQDLEKLPSFVLMPRNDRDFTALKGQVSDTQAFSRLLNLDDFRNGRVLVTRFFAPKIATYYDPKDAFRPIDSDKIVPGWRKLVRLTARSKSAADRSGIRYLYLLFNVKQADADADPYVIESANNQVILVPGDQHAKDSAYFAIYGRRSDGYQLGYFLAADFDLPGHVGVYLPGATDGQYFIPRSCAECHGHSSSPVFPGRFTDLLRGRPVDPKSGQPSENFLTGVYPYAKPNYLDTDQWYDWLEFDFRGVATSLNDVMFDGGKAHGAGQYAAAVDVIRKLNKVIRDQSFAAEQTRGVKSYQTLAAEKWLALHKKDVQRVPYSGRSIGKEQWDPTNRDQMRLLRLLDNHCFRCHSSLIYNVFDRGAVRSEKGNIQSYLKQPLLTPDGDPLPGFKMPQGRVLKDEDRDEIIRLLDVVFSQR